MADKEVIVKIADLKEIHETVMELYDEIKRLLPYYYAWNEIYDDVRRESHIGYPDAIILEMKMREKLEELKP